MNIVLFLTDQERAIQHFPPNWLRQNLPGMRRLRRHGLSFERAFTNACMCSPARSTLMSGYFPAQHGVKYTLEEDMQAAEYPQVEPADRPAEPGHGDEGGRLQRRLQGQVALLETGQQEDAVPADLEQYGFPRWNPPDAGANQSVPEAGGGFIDNDGRFMESVGDPAAGDEGALQYLELDGRQAAAVLHGDLAGQPARRPLLPEQDLRQKPATTTPGCRATSASRRPTKKTSRPSPSVQEEVPAASST